MIWKQHKDLSSEFLTQHHELVLYDIFHHIKALLLFPPNCSCSDSCECTEWRQKVHLALNTHRYNRAYQAFQEADLLYAMKALWHIPEDHLFREQYAESYPVWLAEKELRDREKNNHFKIVNQLVWTYLYLGETNKSSSGAPIVSQNKAMKLILGETPINSKVSKLKNDDLICGGEKEYATHFKKYKFVCHFIAALELWKIEFPDWERVFSCIYPPLEEIERVLKLAHWFREKLLSLERYNVKGNIFLLEKDICPLPSWVHSYDIDFPIEFFEEKYQTVVNQDSVHP